MKMNQRVLACAWVLIAMVSTSVHAQSTIKASPASLHPNLPVTVSGSGFADGEAIDVYIDTVDTALLVSSGTGTFSGPVTVPASASPGAHYITAIGRHSGDAAQVAVTVTTSWFEAGFGAAHLNWNPYENTIGAGNVSQLGTLWNQSAANTGGGTGSTPAIVGGVAYFTTLQGIQARSTTTGALIWKKQTTQRFYASPAVISGVVYAGSYTGTFYALNATTGATIWSRSFGSNSIILSSPMVMNGVVYCAEYESGTVYALSISNGNILWSTTLNGSVDSSPVVVAGTLVIGGGNSIYGLNASTGVIDWQYTTGAPVESTAAIAGGVAYIGSNDDYVYAIHVEGNNPGTLLWRSQTQAAIGAATPAVANGQVFIGSGDGTMYSFDARTGSVDWTAAVGSSINSATVANGVVYASAEAGEILAFNASYGQILGSWALGYSYYGGSSISDGTVYINSYNAGLYALSVLAGVDAVKAKGAPEIESLHPDTRLKAIEQ